MNRKPAHLVSLVLYSAIAMMAFVAIYLMLPHREPEPKETTTTTVVEGTIVAVTGKFFGEKDTMMGRGLSEPMVKFLFMLATATGCHVQIRVEDKLTTVEPQYSFCRRAERGQKVRLQRTTSFSASDGTVLRVYDRLVE